MELDDQLYEKLKRLCNEGDLAMEDQDYKDAYVHYSEAWDLIPEPKTNWEASTWVLAALSDLYFFTEDFDTLRNVANYAMHCPNGIGNPFLHLRLGQAQLELGNEERAKDELARALMGGGRELFDNDDKKYFEFITKFMKPPVGESTW